MAKPLNKYQKLVNTEIKKLDPKAKSSTSKEFETNQYAKKLEQLLEASEIYFNEKIINKNLFSDYKDLEVQFRKNLFWAIGDKEYDDNRLWDCCKDTRLHYESTAEFWGLQRVSLINKIKHQDYDLATMSDEDYFENPYKYLYNSRDRWVEKCHVVDKMINYTKEKFPNWNTMKKSEKNQYIKYLDDLSSAPFLDDSENLILYVSYLKKFGLNQSKKAKAKLLLQFEFPNISDEKTALEIIEYTNLFILSKNK